MVISERNGDTAYTSRQRSRTLNSNINSSNSNYSSNNDSDTEQSVRVGKDYQADIPDFVSPLPAPTNYPEKSIQIWTTNNSLESDKIDDYLNIAREKYHYNAEQALGVLHWHNYDLKCALADLPNYVPYPDEWTMEDKVIFEQGFQFHSKNFHKINQLLPDKKISNLVHYYYTWKNSKSKQSTVEKQVKKVQTRDGSTNDSNEAMNDFDTDYESNQNVNSSCEEPPSRQDPGECSKCLNRTQITYNTKFGILCRNCYNQAIKNVNKTENTPMDENSIPPNETEFDKLSKPLLVDENTLKEIVKEHQIGAEKGVLAKLDEEIEKMNQDIQILRQRISNEKVNMTGLKDFPLLNQCNNRAISRWTPDEIVMVSYAIAEHGKNFKKIAEIIGTKSECQIKNFFLQNNEKMKLSSLVSENDESM